MRPAPSLNAASTSARPIPRLAPVMRIVLPSICILATSEWAVVGLGGVLAPPSPLQLRRRRKLVAPRKRERGEQGGVEESVDRGDPLGRDLEHHDRVGLELTGWARAGGGDGRAALCTRRQHTFVASFVLP